VSRAPGQRATGAYPLDIATIDAEHFHRFIDHRWKGRHDKDGYGIYSVWDPTAGKAANAGLTGSPTASPTAARPLASTSSTAAAVRTRVRQRPSHLQRQTGAARLGGPS